MSYSSFASFDLHPLIQNALADLGYQAPTPIQLQSIPVLLAGKDLIAQAQTGTGKTAAFSLPLLHHINPTNKNVQALVLAPTRELAIQVAEAIEGYAQYMKGVYVAAVCGGQEMDRQIRALKRGVQIVVGTPGRLMDHMRRGFLDLSSLKTLVLDEADEMLRMGFIEDVQWILSHVPQVHQACLFSATMPHSIKKIAEEYLTDPEHIKIKSATPSHELIEQRVMMIPPHRKFEALVRYLEVALFDAALLFVRTKTMAADLSDRLSAEGYRVAALHGDMSQQMREKVIERVKQNKLDMVVATDVAARGLDVERITHVVNFDAPYDVATYTHRIGRTGRAGRVGKSLLMLTPKERYFLRDLERSVKQPVEVITPPTAQALSEARLQAFNKHLAAVLDKGRLDFYRDQIDQFIKQSGHDAALVAAALFKMAQKNKPLQVQEDPALFAGDDAPPNRLRKKVKPKRGAPVYRSHQAKPSPRKRSGSASRSRHR